MSVQYGVGGLMYLMMYWVTQATLCLCQVDKLSWQASGVCVYCSQSQESKVL